MQEAIASGQARDQSGGNRTRSGVTSDEERQDESRRKRKQRFMDKRSKQREFDDSVNLVQRTEQRTLHEKLNKIDPDSLSDEEKKELDHAKEKNRKKLVELEFKITNIDSKEKSELEFKEHLRKPHIPSLGYTFGGRRRIGSERRDIIRSNLDDIDPDTLKTKDRTVFDKAIEKRNKEREKKVKKFEREDKKIPITTSDVEKIMHEENMSQKDALQKAIDTRKERLEQTKNTIRDPNPKRRDTEQEESEMKRKEKITKIFEEKGFTAENVGSESHGFDDDTDTDFDDTDFDDTDDDDFDRFSDSNLEAFNKTDGITFDKFNEDQKRKRKSISLTDVDNDDTTLAKNGFLGIPMTKNLVVGERGMAEYVSIKPIKPIKSLVRKGNQNIFDMGMGTGMMGMGMGMGKTKKKQPTNIFTFDTKTKKKSKKNNIFDFDFGSGLVKQKRKGSKKKSNNIFDVGGF